MVRCWLRRMSRSLKCDNCLYSSSLAMEGRKLACEW